MELQYYQINTFADEIFGGNPAVVIKLDYWLADDLLLKIARESRVDATAFIVDEGGIIFLRWFTPDLELDLCGHASLAAAHALKSLSGDQQGEIKFETAAGRLFVSLEEGRYIMNLPARRAQNAVLPIEIKSAISLQPSEVLKARDYVLVYRHEDEVRNIEINRVLFDSINIDPGGVIVTARGVASDFVSRFFVPQASIHEDPVTGSAHCSLIPYWSEKLGKKEMLALQLSERGGMLFCKNAGERVLIGGYARTYACGSIYL